MKLLVMHLRHIVRKTQQMFRRNILPPQETGVRPCLLPDSCCKTYFLVKWQRIRPTFGRFLVRILAETLSWGSSWLLLSHTSRIFHWYLRSRPIASGLLSSRLYLKVVRGCYSVPPAECFTGTLEVDTYCHRHSYITHYGRNAQACTYILTITAVDKP
jgi:hypothetical protein